LQDQGPERIRSARRDGGRDQTDQDALGHGSTRPDRAPEGSQAKLGPVEKLGQPSELRRQEGDPEDPDEARRAGNPADRDAAKQQDHAQSDRDGSPGGGAALLGVPTLVVDVAKAAAGLALLQTTPALSKGVGHTRQLETDVPR